MNIIWERGEAGVADVLEALREHRSLSRNTVQTLLTRLAAKGWLKVRKDGNAFLFSPAAEQKKTLGDMVRQLIDVAFKGSAQGLVMTLLEERGLSRDEKDRIQEMIEQSRTTARGRTPKEK